MEVTILGSGSAYGTPQAGNYYGSADKNEPRNQRSRSSILFDLGNCNFLIDSGPDIRTQLNVNNISHIDAVLFTHAHADHISGLVDIQRLASNQKHEINLFCSKETFELIKRCYFFLFDNENKDRGLESLKWNVFENGDEIEFSGYSFQTVGLPHNGQPSKRMISTAIRYKNFMFATDFNEIPEEKEEIFKNLDCLVMETNNGFNSTRPKNGHNNFYQAFEMKDKFSIKKFVLTHLSIDVDYARDSEKMPESFELAYDGMKFKI